MKWKTKTKREKKKDRRCDRQNWNRNVTEFLKINIIKTIAKRTNVWYTIGDYKVIYNILIKNVKYDIKCYRKTI